MTSEGVGPARRYRVYAMVFDRAGPPPWRRDVWSAALPALDAIFGERKTAVRSFQQDATNKTRGWVKLGRLAWNEAGHRKWTHPMEGSNLRFSSTDFAAPSLATFDKTHEPPDVYANLFAGIERFATRDGRWDLTTKIVDPNGFFVGVALDDPELARVDAATHEVAATWRATALGRKDRTWAATPNDPSLIQRSLVPDPAAGWISMTATAL
jgi:hypothetical protein